MTTAKKAATKSASIVDDESAMVDKIAHDIQPTSEQSGGPDPELGFTKVADRSAIAEAKAEGTVRMVSTEGEVVEMDAANARIHERSGWKRLEEDEV